MTHSQYDTLTITERAAYDALVDADRGQNSLMWDLIRRSMKTAEKFRLLLWSIGQTMQESMDDVVSIVGELAANAIAAAQQAEDKEDCQCEGYCYHQTTT